MPNGFFTVQDRDHPELRTVARARWIFFKAPLGSRPEGRPEAAQRALISVSGEGKEEDKSKLSPTCLATIREPGFSFAFDQNPFGRTIWRLALTEMLFIIATNVF